MRFVIIILILVFCSTSYAQEPPFEFKGIALGSSISEIRNDSRFSCEDSKRPIADQICSLKYGVQETIAGAPIKYLGLGYYSGKLESIYWIQCKAFFKCNRGSYSKTRSGNYED